MTFESAVLPLNGRNKEVADAFLSGLAYGEAKQRKSASTRIKRLDAEQADAPPAPVATGSKLTPEDRARLRLAIVRRIWEPELRSKLVDRLVFLADAGIVGALEIGTEIEIARERKERENRALWTSLSAWCKRQYERAGLTWTPTAPTLEPKPPRPKSPTPEDAEDAE